MYQPVINRSYLTEIKLVNPPGVGQKVPFLDVPQLRGVNTVGITAYTAKQLTLSPQSNVVVSLATGLVLTLAINNTEEIFQFPVIDLIPGENSGLIRLFKNKMVNLPKSYITILDPAALAQNEAVVFNFIYENR